jgi:hypothetical protein
MVTFTFVGPEDGWANTDRGVLLATVDGGRSWLTRTAPVPISTLCATPSHLWVGASGGDIYASVGITSWRLSLSGGAVPSPFVNSVGPNPAPTPWLACTGLSVWALYQDGEAAGSDPFVVERTFDGGVHWAPLTPSNGVPPVASPTEISVVAQTTASAPGSAWILGYCGACGAMGTNEVATTSAGSAFASAALPSPPATTTTASPVGLSFLDATLGWAVIQVWPAVGTGGGTTPTDALLSSDDGGASWWFVNPDIDTRDDRTSAPPPLFPVR